MEKESLLLFSERQFSQKADGFWRSIYGQTLYTIYYYTILYPLQRIYYRGFWKALPLEDICAKLTSTHADFWRMEHNYEECIRIIQRDFDSWIVWLEVGTYFVVMLCLARFVLKQIFHPQKSKSGSETSPKKK